MSRLHGPASRVPATLLALALAGCAPRSQTPPAARASPDLQIALALRPARPRSLDPTAFQVTLRDAQGRPVTGAAVTVELVMPAMDMGRNAVPAGPQAPGVYGGTGRFTMAGDWRVTVTAARGAARSVQIFPVSVP